MRSSSEAMASKWYRLKRKLDRRFHVEAVLLYKLQSFLIILEIIIEKTFHR